ncbi:hypothetical protein CEXT_798161 [Caerostris extrusa]|uniref:Uncharacterized protein n=1 Tax=Caerostris extrusa TaxID=172846 RepID=A0AAV4REW9_CAEEX|nr:hypothetical protein CEXT_798161 [Caerostris extrusa]
MENRKCQLFSKTTRESIRSPCFKLSSLDKTYWFLKCFPRGVRNKLVVACKLAEMINIRIQKKINIGFKAYVTAFDGSSAFEREKDSLLIEKGEETKIIVNVWKVLKISHDHGDEELKASAINHICQHVKEVLNGRMEAEIVDNILLATEILRYLSSVIQETYKENQSL